MSYFYIFPIDKRSVLYIIYLYRNNIITKEQQMTLTQEESDKMTVIILRCPESLKASAEETAAKNDTDLSKFIRQAIREKIARTAAPAPTA